MQNQPAAQSQPPAARQMDQSLLSMDPVQRQVFICLLPFRGQMSLSFLTVLACPYILFTRALIVSITN